MSAAVFTIAHDEDFHLANWVEYYLRNFAPEDIYVLDHDTTSPPAAVALEMIRNRGVNVIDVHHDTVFDHDWLRLTVMAYQQTLLNRYDYVLFAEADELVVPRSGTLRRFVESATAPAYRCRGVRVYGNIGSYFDPMYDKTLLSSVPLSWVEGFHTATPEIPVGDELFLLELHKWNYDEAWNRNHRFAAQRWDQKAIDEGYGIQSQITEQHAFDEWFCSIIDPMMPRVAVRSILAGVTSNMERWLTL